MSMTATTAAQTFLSTPSARRATASSAGASGQLWISIHALREEGDQSPCVAFCIFRIFLSTPSARRATCPKLTGGKDNADFYPRPPRGGRRSALGSYHSILRYFYPRPPRGGRLLDRTINGEQHVISIHALREEGDISTISSYAQYTLFLSTPSARRATAKTEKNISAFVSL